MIARTPLQGQRKGLKGEGREEREMEGRDRGAAEGEGSPTN